jgi:hypothetical protein
MGEGEGMTWWHPPQGLAAACREPISATAGAVAAGTAASTAAAGAAATAGAVATGTSVAAGTTAAATLASIGSYATIASTIAGVGLQVLSARQQAAAQRGQAAMTDFAARQEMIRGQQQGNALRESLLRALAGQRARYAASGLAPDDGTAMNLQEETAAQAERELTIQDSNSIIRSEEQRTRASLLADGADFTETGGVVRAGVNLFDAYDRYSQRRPGTVRRPGE